MQFSGGKTLLKEPHLYEFKYPLTISLMTTFKPQIGY